MKVLTPWDVALRMMRNGRDPGLIVAYLEEEARRAGVDPLDLSMHPYDELSRDWRDVKAQLAAVLGAYQYAWNQLARRFATARDLQSKYALAGPP